MILEGGALVLFFLRKRLLEYFHADGGIVTETTSTVHDAKTQAVITSYDFGTQTLYSWRVVTVVDAALHVHCFVLMVKNEPHV
jgi:hypothetical protein